MRLRSRFASTLAAIVWLWSLILAPASVYAQEFPSPDQLDQLLAPIALFPDPLVAQICAASTDPQQILDANAWLHQNLTLTGQARTDAASAQGFDPAFIALMNFAQVLDMMARNINDFAAIGRVFAVNQGWVMDSIQRLRQQAYSVGALQSNEFQTVNFQGQGASQVVVIQPANPQVIFVPQYNPQVVFAAPSTFGVVGAPLLTFGAGIALGAWIMDINRPWGWGGWGWNWGRRTVIVNNNFWVVNNRWRSPHPTFRPRPPAFNRPVYVRPPPNWRERPNFRPPPGGRPPGSRPGVNPPTPGVRPPGGRPGSGPSVNPPTPGVRPPGGRPGSGPSVNPPTGQRPPGMTRPAPAAPQRPPNPSAGFPRGPGPDRSAAGGRPGAFGGGNAAAARAASDRGRASVASEQRQAAGGGRRR